MGLGRSWGSLGMDKGLDEGRDEGRVGGRDESQSGGSTRSSSSGRQGRQSALRDEPRLTPPQIAADIRKNHVQTRCVIAQ